nr:putative acyl-coa-binding protein [Quercus suber]
MTSVAAMITAPPTCMKQHHNKQTPSIFVLLFTTRFADFHTRKKKISSIMAPAAKSAAFEQAVADSRNLKAKPNNDELLELYAFFKQGTNDPPFEKSPVPGMFALTDKAKRGAWQKVHEKGTTPEDAQEQYVSLVNSLKEKYGFEG